MWKKARKNQAFGKVAQPCWLCSLPLAATDAEIDDLVYDLYGLTDDERKIIEEATKTQNDPRVRTKA